MSLPEQEIDQWTDLPPHQIHPANADYMDGVRCVSMPCCGFTYDAGHTDSNGLYTCPLCEDE